MICPEWIHSHSLVQFAKSHQTGMHWYWTNAGVALFFSLTQSSQEDVQEMVVGAVSAFTIADYEYVGINLAFARVLAH